MNYIFDDMIRAACEILTDIKRDADGDREAYDIEVDAAIQYFLDSGDLLSAQIWETWKPEIWDNEQFDIRMF